MSNIQKNSTEIVFAENKLIVNSDNAPSYFIKDGDFVIDRNFADSVFQVKLIDDHIELIQEDGHLYTKFLKERDYHYGSFKEFLGRFLVIPIKSFSDDLDEVLKKFLLEKEEAVNENCYALVSKKQSDLIAIRDKQFNILRKQEILKTLIKFKQNKISCYVNELEKQLENMNTVLWQIKLYNNIVENIVQIQVGVPCDSPVTIRQKILFMDEEITHNNVDNADFDFYDIEKFDEWLLQDHEKFNKKNFEVMLPEEKGVVVLKVRRNDKDYQDKWENAINNQYNRSYYVFLRNGTNLYRIFTENHFGYNLLPTEKDFQKMESEDRDKGDKAILSARQNMLVIQGIIDNTTLFESENFKISGLVNLLDEKTYKDKVNAVFDNENIIAPLETYKDYQKEINKTIEIGSRIAFFGGKVSAGSSTSEWDRKNGIWLRPGIYVVVGYGEPTYGDYLCFDTKEKTECFKVMALAQNIRNGEESKKARYIYNDECFNYDLLELEKLENFMYDRISRESTTNLPQKVKLLKQTRIAEKRFEDAFVDSLKLEYSEDKIRQAISWWKLKNKWKRGLMSDDSKALRMIKKYLEKE